MSFFLVAITLGFLGSFHCIGMCGPIALALPVHHEPVLKRIFLTLSYNGGRILTYSIFGLLAGLLGQGFFAAGFQQMLSIVIGTILLASVILPISGIKIKSNTMVFALMNRIKTALSKLFLKKGHRPLVLIGLLNGLLPCGLVYMGIAGAIATGDLMKGAAFMAIFGLGTLPAMFVLPLAGSSISVRFRNNIRRAVPVFITLTAILLILRGLNLGIPFVSPKVEENKIPACHAQLTPSKQNTILCTGHDSQLRK
jgi:uncharacterized protein